MQGCAVRKICEGAWKLQIYEIQDVQHKHFAPKFKVAFSLEHSPAQGSKNVPSDSPGQVPADGLNAQVG